MAEPNGSETPPNPENNGAPVTTPPEGNENWKAKFEGLQAEYNTLEQNRNFFKNKSEDLETKNTDLAKKVEDVQSEFTQYKDGISGEQKKNAAKTKASEVLAGYDDKVKKLAEISGLELTDADDEDAVKAFTEKLDQIKENVGETTPPAGDPKPPRKQPPVGGNNNSTTPPAPKKETDEERLARQEEELADVTF